MPQISDDDAYSLEMRGIDPENIDTTLPDEDTISPVAAITATGGNPAKIKGGLSGLMMKRAEEIAPQRADVVAKRQALMGAFDRLLQAQRYREPATNDPAAVAFSTNMLAQNPGLDASSAALGKAIAAEAAARQGMADRRTAAEQEQAKTGLEAANTDLGFLNSDQANELDLLKNAGLADYRNEMLQMRMALASMNKTRPVKLSDGSYGLYTPGSDTITPLGGSGGPSASNDRIDLAKQYGVPLADPRLDPTRNMTPQGRSTYINRTQQQLDKEAGQLQDLEKHENDIDQFLDTNAKATTGGFRSLPVIRDFYRAFSPEWQTMASQNKNLSFANRPANMRMTQMEWQAFRDAATSPSNSFEANQNIANAMKAYLQRQKDWIQFRNDYNLVNGHLNGSEQAFNKYMEENPIFAKNANTKNHFALNPDRMSYQDYFAKKYGWNTKDESQPDTSTETGDTSKPVVLKGAKDEVAVPKGVDPEDWKYATPEQKKLWGM